MATDLVLSKLVTRQQLQLMVHLVSLLDQSQQSIFEVLKQNGVQIAARNLGIFQLIHHHQSILILNKDGDKTEGGTRKACWVFMCIMNLEAALNFIIELWQ